MKNTYCLFTNNSISYSIFKNKRSFLFNLLYSILIVFIFTSQARANLPDWAAGLSITYTPSSGNCGAGSLNCYELRVDGIPLNLNPAGDSKGYSCFWYFGDGSFEITEIDTVSQFTSVFHEFRTVNNNGVYLQLTRRYDDDEKPIKLTLPNPPFSPLPSTAIRTTILEPDLNKAGLKAIELTPSLAPRSGDIATYVLSYQIPSSCESNSSDVMIELRYYNDVDNNNTNNVLIPEDPIIYNVNGTISPFGTTSAPGNYDNNNGTLTFSVGPQNHTNRTIHSYIPFEFINISEGKEIRFDMSIYNAGSDTATCLKTPITNDFTILSVRSHDPNKIYSNVKKICPTDMTLDTMEYTIVFQNLGSGAANIVHVRNILPDYFKYDETSIHTLEPEGLDFITPLNPATRELRWVLSTSNQLLKKGYPVRELKGTGQNNFKQGSPNEHYTLDTIKFSVTFDKNVALPPCGVIPNRATIYFDNNPPIVTKDHFTRITCSDCIKCDTLEKINIANPVFLRNGQPLTYSDPSILSDRSSVYPNASKWEKSNGDVSATFSKPGVYTVITVDGCSRTITEIPVINASAHSNIIEKCNWWTCKLSLEDLSELDSSVYYWEYKKDKEWVTKTGNSLNFTGVDTASVMIQTRNGDMLFYRPCVLCWKNLILKYWWLAVIVFTFFFIIVYIFFKAIQNKKT